MSMLLGLLALLPLWALGHLARRALGLHRNALADVIDDFVCGVVVLGLIGTVLVIAGRLAVWPVYLALALAWVLARRNRTPRASQGRDDPAGRHQWWRGTAPRGLGVWASLAAALVMGVLVVTALTDRLTWDGWAFWTLRAKILLLEGGFPPVVFQKPGPLDFAHPEYPLLVPLVDWWMFAHAGAPMPALASAAGGLWLAALVGLLWTELRPRTDLLTAGLAALGLALFRPIGEHATGGMAEVVMALALLGTVVSLRSATSEGGQEDWVRAALYLSLGALAKNEGTAAAVAVLIGVAIWALPRRHRLPMSAATLLVPLALGVGWQLYARSLGLGVEQIGDASTVGDLMDRLILIAGAVLRLSVYRSWGPAVLLIALGYGVWVVRREAGPAFWLLPIYLAMAMAVYLSTQLDLAWLLDTSLDRVVSHTVPAGVFLALVAMAGKQPAAVASRPTRA